MNRQNSVISILSSGSDFCRICHCDSTCGELISPCYCSGSLRWVHKVCLQHWIRASNSKACELCRYPFSIRSKLRPPCEWEALPMSTSERRRMFCSAIFHTMALFCVIWSLYILIDRTIHELKQSDMEWQFWTKIVVEAIGCLGAGILLYVWGKIYFSLLRKWLLFNRTFVIVHTTPVPIKEKAGGVLLIPPTPTPCHPTSSEGGGQTGPEEGVKLLPPLLYVPPVVVDPT